MASGGSLIKTNGHVSWTTLAVTGGAALAFLTTYISLSIAPLQKDIDRNSDGMKEIRQMIVPRGEHEEKWRSQQATDERLRADVKEIQRQIGGTYSMRDELLRLQREVECLRNHNCSPASRSNDAP